jgi:hypothetical protein
MIDWEPILKSRGVEVVLSGPSTSKGNIYVRCPFCGGADQGHHMGISIHAEYRGWACWKNKRHRGKSPSRLLAAILAIPEAQAAAILGLRRSAALIPDNGLQAAWDKALGLALGREARSYPRLPKAIRPLKLHRGFQGKFLDYIEARGYPGEGLLVAEYYDIHWAQEGAFTYRIIFLVRDQFDNLITWTGRTIGEQEPRYLTQSTNPESKLVYGDADQAYRPINDYLFQEARLFRQPKKTLIVCEGAFDAMRVDWAFRRVDGNARATCLWGKAVTASQLDKLATLAGFYDHKLLMLDPDAAMDNFAIMEELSPFGFKPCYLDEGWEDPGDANLPFSELRRIIFKAIGGL